MDGQSVMHQQSFRFYDLYPEQLSLDLVVPWDSQPKLYLDTGLLTAIATDGTVGTISSYITLSNPSGVEQARLDDHGLSIKVENKSWLKTKVANWLGLKYL